MIRLRPTSSRSNWTAAAAVAGNRAVAEPPSDVFAARDVGHKLTDLNATNAPNGGLLSQSETNQMECYMRKVTFRATLFVVLVAASVASAQGTVRGAQDGAEAGGQAAGPVGAVVGGAVGAATGTVGGILGVPPGPPPNASTSTEPGRAPTRPANPTEKR